MMTEDLHHEFKEAKRDLPKNLFDTVCAFLNTDGGTVYLGLSDDGSVSGIEETEVARLKREIADISNNPQKLDPPYLLFPKQENRDGKPIIVLQVPLSSQIHRHRGEIYLRSEDGDYRVKGAHQLAGLLNRKLGIFPEQTPMPSFTMQDLRPDLFERARELMRIRNQNHPWLALSDSDLLHVAGLLAEISQKEQPTLTLAAILLFGSDSAIQRALPGYKFDCLLRRKDVDRYDDRLMIRTNLIDAYDQMMGFVEKHLNDPFYLDGDMSISLRERIFREAISNVIAHRDYRNASPGRLMIYADRIIMDNPSTRYFYQTITPLNLASHPKNPSICKFMLQLGRFDELGSGVINIHKYLPLYANGAKPLFEDKNEGFCLTLPLRPITINPVEAPVKAPVEAPVEAPVRINETDKKILTCLKEGPSGRKGILSYLGYSQPSGNYKASMDRLLNASLIERTLPELPTSRLQQYRLTDKGRRLLETLATEQNKP